MKNIFILSVSMFPKTNLMTLSSTQPHIWHAPGDDWPEQNPNAKLGILAMCHSRILRKHPKKEQYVVLYENTDRMGI
jgi:hypothetical protein